MGLMTFHAPTRAHAAKRKNVAGKVILRALRRNLTKRRAKGKGSFSKRVNKAVLNREPMQYTLRGQDRIGLSTTPVIIAEPSKLPFNNFSGGCKYARSSPKVFVKGITFQFVLSVQDSYNKISFALVRHKRSEEIVSGDIALALGGPVTTLDDKPFLPCENANDHYYNTVPLNMVLPSTAISHPFMLNDMWNPKVVDVIKRWDIQLEAEQAGSTYPAYRNVSYYHKFNEVWKYPNQVSADASNTPIAPYNNKNYYLIGWSDSKLVPNPTISYSYRTSFKDID